MRSLTTITAVAMFAATFASAFALATPSYATGAPKNNNCYWSNHKKYCPGTRVSPGSSTELFPSTCNGELGFWTSVTFANGETLCIARSTADFYHNGNLVPTCTVKYWDHDLHKKIITTTDGTCPAKTIYNGN